jgi:uncharacterized protein YndB with AHSA1/START domain
MSNKMTITAEPGQPIIRIERAFNAPRTAVFEIFTQKDKLEKWWSPYGSATIEQNFTEGGAWKFAEGTEVVFYGYYHEISAPERFVQTSEFANLPERGHVVLERYDFTEQADGTTLITLTEAYLSVADRDAALQSGMQEGLAKAYDKADALLGVENE